MVLVINSICFIYTCTIAQNKSLPNILWLSVEDMSPRLGCYGDYTVPTPHIDRLAAQGVLYTRVFTTAGVCAPSRNAIATGRIQTSNGGHNMRTLTNTFPEFTGLPSQYSVVMPDGVFHFAEKLRSLGYFCTNNAKTDYQFEEPVTVWDENSGTAHYTHRAPNQPFFAVFNCMYTHESQIWARAQRPLRVNPANVKLPPYYPDTDSIRLDIARHYTNISEMDDWVGEKIGELEKLGLMENTIIFFWSDHGDGLPFVKREIYSRGIHIPLIVRFPKNHFVKGQLAPGTRNDRLISAIDFAPTVLSLADIKPPKVMQGIPFLGSYYQSKSHPYVYAARDRCDEHYDRVRSVTDGMFIYVYHFNTQIPRYQDITFRKGQASMREILRMRDAGTLDEIQMRWFEPTKPREELYHISQDPHALNDLAANPLFLPQIKKFRHAFAQWQKSTPDDGEIPEKQLVKKMWNQGDSAPVTLTPMAIQKGKLIKIHAGTPSSSIAYQWLSPGEKNQNRWQVYTKPIVIHPGSTLLFLAHRIGYLPSQTMEFTVASQ
jgi:N-sulfoglucosamine sulfohydrolase